VLVILVTEHRAFINAGTRRNIPEYSSGSATSGGFIFILQCNKTVDVQDLELFRFSAIKSSRVMGARQ
jgi:hypothetical protein